MVVVDGHSPEAGLQGCHVILPLVVLFHGGVALVPNYA
jgi:hypothetical protein